jgi:hypothetical protein
MANSDTVFSRFLRYGNAIARLKTCAVMRVRVGGVVVCRCGAAA